MVLPDAVPGFGFDPPGVNVSENKCQQDDGDEYLEEIHFFLFPGPGSELWEVVGETEAGLED